MKHSVATVIHYCTNDYRFLRRSIDEARRFSDLIVIPICDHFFNGEPERRALMEKSYRDFPECRFLEFAYYPDRLYSPYLKGYSSLDREWGFFWHSTSRYIAALFLPEEIEYALFLDADEIVDGRRFSDWLATGEHRSYSAARLLCYTYVHQANLLANQFFTSSLLARKEALDPGRMIHAEDRAGIFQAIAGPKASQVVDANKRPFIHHYPWVRTKEEALRKAETWAHRRDKDWRSAIERIAETRMDLDLEFVEVEPFFDPLAAEPLVFQEPGAPFSNVTRVDLALAHRRDIERFL